MSSVAEKNQAYLDAHPEVKDLLSQFVCEILKSKPLDVKSFGEQFFADLARPSPLVIVGPSGVGKGTLIKMLMEEFGSNLGFSISHTTRAARPGEVHGEHYHFSSHEEIRDGVSRGEFVEHAEVGGCCWVCELCSRHL
jgi:guanylate kinase